MNAAVDDVVARAHAAQPAWSAMSIDDRAAILRRARKRLLNDAERFVDVMVDELGKLSAEARLLDVAPSAAALSWAANAGPKALSSSTITTLASPLRTATSTWKPRGVCAVLSPWNYPLAIPLGSIAAALVGGNSVVWKPSEHASRTSSLLRDVLVAAGVPVDVIGLCVGAGDVGRSVIDADVDHVTFVGSTAVGRTIAARCGERLIPSIIELGGKAPAIVVDGADLERTANAIVFGGFANAGQSCVAVERVYVVDHLFDALFARVTTLAAQTPLARAVLGDKGLPRVVDVTNEPDSPLLRDEVFGPCLPFVRVSSSSQAVRLANAHHLQLAAYVFGDKQHARAVASQLRAPQVAIDDAMIHYALPELPFGGVGDSGFGRVHGDDGLRALCVQQIVVEPRVRPAREAWWQPYPGHRTVLRVVDRALDVVDRLRR